jgi:hypothetical protein
MNPSRRALQVGQLHNDFRAVAHDLSVGVDDELPRDVLRHADRVIRQIESGQLLAHPIARFVSGRGHREMHSLRL